MSAHQPASRELSAAESPSRVATPADAPTSRPRAEASSVATAERVGRSPTAKPGPTQTKASAAGAGAAAPAKARTRGAASTNRAPKRAPRRQAAAWPAPVPQAVVETKAALQELADTRVAESQPAPAAAPSPIVAPTPPTQPQARVAPARPVPPTPPAPPAPPARPMARTAPPVPPTPPAPPITRTAPPTEPTAPEAPVARVAPPTPHAPELPVARTAPPTPPTAPELPVARTAPPTPRTAPERPAARTAPPAEPEPASPVMDTVPDHGVAAEPEAWVPRFAVADDLAPASANSEPDVAPEPADTPLVAPVAADLVEAAEAPAAPVIVEPAASVMVEAAAAPAAPVIVEAPAAPAAPVTAEAAEAPDDDPSSKAPPGFTGPAILAAESPTLLALDPTDEEEQAAPLVETEAATVGGSAILAKVAALTPRRGDLGRFARSKDATLRVVVGAAVLVLLLVLVAPFVLHQLGRLPVFGTMIDQLDTYHLYPGAYGVPWAATFFGALSATGLVVAQMERNAERADRRRDPVTRLNIGLAGVLGLSLSGGVLSTFHTHGWAAAAASLTFFLAACLLVPLGRLPGARAMAYQPDRAWALLTLLAAAGFVIAPSLPLGLTLVLAFTHVRTNWAAVSRGDDAHRGGPIDSTNRLSALLITGFVLIASAIGMHTMTLSPAQVHSSTDETRVIPGTERLPTIKAPTP